MKVPRRKPLNARIGVMSIGLDTYWKQFDGLLDELLKKTDVFKRKVTALSAEVVDFGMLDNSQKAYAALPKILAADLDLLFVDMVTYGTSGTLCGLGGPCRPSSSASWKATPWRMRKSPNGSPSRMCGMTCGRRGSA